MYFEKNSNRLTARKQNERILIEAWGNNALRVRVTHNADFTEDDKALSPVLSSAQITIDDSKASIRNGKISCVIAKSGWLEFYSDKKPILKEYYRVLAMPMSIVRA